MAAETIRVPQRAGNDKLKSAFELVAKKWGVVLYQFNANEVRPRESVRLKCQAPLCEYYDVCKVCPPNVPTVAEFREALQSYNKAFLVVLQEKITDIEIYRTDFRAELKLADVIADLEQTAFQLGHYLALGLVVGGCKLCRECTPAGEPCRHPFRPRPSPEGLGIDVTELARQRGVAVEWPPRKEISFIGLILI